MPKQIVTSILAIYSYHGLSTSGDVVVKSVKNVDPIDMVYEVLAPCKRLAERWDDCPTVDFALTTKFENRVYEFRFSNDSFLRYNLQDYFESIFEREEKYLKI